MQSVFVQCTQPAHTVELFMSSGQLRMKALLRLPVQLGIHNVAVCQGRDVCQLNTILPFEWPSQRLVCQAFSKVQEKA